MTVKLTSIVVFAWFIEAVQQKDKGLLGQKCTIVSNVVKDPSLFRKKLIGNVLSNKEYFCFYFQ